VDLHHDDGLAQYGENFDAPIVHLMSGTPYVSVGPQCREVPEGSKQLLVLVALKRRRVERRWAAGTLWPFGDEARAAGNLRSALWRLRRAGIDVLSVDKWSLTLSKDALVDLHVMDQRATRLIDGKARADDFAVSSLWAGALDLLPGWYDEWLVMERERVRQRILHALEALSRQLASMGRFADAVEAAMLALGAEPLRESAQRALITVYVAEGNLAEARRSYRSFRDLVHRELGVEPSTDLLRDVLSERVSQVRSSRQEPASASIASEGTALSSSASMRS
jgi:DNA-binding SARP family transcriptional activator